ncbi:MAG: hypothetical protein FWF63_11180 [Fibromonadales bacterium]|nr:hypothetical protein [Fibromonadales bacterium]
MFEELEETQKEQSSPSFIAYIITALIAGGGWFLYMQISEKHIEKQVEKETKNIAVQMAIEEEQKYKLVQESGSSMDKCVHAGAVALAWLQTQNSERYKKWKEIEKAQCAKVGIYTD